MKRLLLLSLITIPLFGFPINFIYCDYDDDWDDEYWCDEYWEPEPWCDEYWVSYPSGYYCVYYVWYHPWWWDWYWWHCHWCHHFDWHFFCAGFYVVWYEDGCWWWRPRYGRWVRYKLPYAYNEFRYKAGTYGVNLPEKPPREIKLPYKENEILRLTKEKDPQLYYRLKKEYRSGNLERMKKEYQKRVEKEIAVKNEQYHKTRNGIEDREVIDKSRNDFENRGKIPHLSEKTDENKGNVRIIKRQKEDAMNEQKEREESERIEKRKSSTKARYYNREERGKNPQNSIKRPVPNLPPVDGEKDFHNKSKRYRS